MDEFVRLPSADRRLYCDEAQARIGLPAASIEKDFWVCWTLREVFALPEWEPHLFFKGGTSLSKCWKLISRFSEDIDLVVQRDFLGFGGDCSPEFAASRKQQSHRLDALRDACVARLHGDFLPGLRARFEKLLNDSGSWELDSDPNDLQTLLFRYPTANTSPSHYIRPVVKIEIGARSDTEPSEMPEISPYLADAIPGLFQTPSFRVRAVAPVRTFWEKALLLHEETCRPPTKKRNPRLSRHYYDLWSLISNGIADKALGDRALFNRIVNHRRVFFRQNWVDYDALVQGLLHLTPPPEQMDEWRRDYAAMNEMIFGQAPTFDDILDVMKAFEDRFNSPEE